MPGRRVRLIPQALRCRLLPRLDAADLAVHETFARSLSLVAWFVPAGWENVCAAFGSRSHSDSWRILHQQYPGAPEKCLSDRLGIRRDCPWGNRFGRAHGGALAATSGAAL